MILHKKLINKISNIVDPKNIITNSALLKFHNKVLSEQLQIAIKGLETIVALGDVADVSKKTLSFMTKIEKEVSRNEPMFN